MADDHAAYHEAGHAVVRIRLRLSVQHVTVQATGRTAGHVQHRTWSPKKSSLGRLLNEAVAAYAGPIAEERHTGHRDDAGAGASGAPMLVRGSDYDSVSEIVLLLTEDAEEQEALSRWLWRRSEVYVAALWTEIERVARALAERHTLTKEEIWMLMYPVRRLPST